jgi:glycosyltransferase involved in cell wall biosynthesis
MTTRDKIRLRYVGSFGQNSGYAQATHDYLLALVRAGVELDISPIIGIDPSWKPGRYEELLPFVDRADAAYATWPTHAIVHTIPLGLKIVLEEENIPGDVKRVAMTTWETSKFPDQAAEDIRGYFDQVWVPSAYSADAIVGAGCPEKAVKVVWHTFDPAVWWPQGWKPSRAVHELARGRVGAPSPEPYTFYSVLTWCERKNPIGLLKAYLTSFDQRDNVLLKIKTPGVNHAQIEELARGLGLDYLPPVDLICEHLSGEAMRRLHIESDCYVTCARAEGWGLGAFEALLVGNPVIGTDYSGLKEFMDDAYGVEQIPCFLTPAYTPETPANTSMQVAGMTVQAINRNDHYGIRGDQNWAEPDLHALKSHMRWAYEDRIGKTDANMETFEKRYGYAAVAERIIRLLEDM